MVLLQVLRRRCRPVTAAALADQWGVAPRTLYRDIEMLRGQGATIEGAAGLCAILRCLDVPRTTHWQRSSPCCHLRKRTPLRQAIRTGHKVDLRHTDKEAQASNRVVGPVAIGFFEAAEALAAWCELCSGFRHFGPDRITGVETARAAIGAGIELAFAVLDADAVYVA